MENEKIVLERLKLVSEKSKNEPWIVISFYDE